MRKMGRCMNREGIGGFLESILAVMVVITACSVFMVVLASGALLDEEEIDQKEVVSWLKANGLRSENMAIPIDLSDLDLDRSALPEDLSGMTVTYRQSGEPTPLLVLGKGGAPQGDVTAFQLPQLIEIEGRSVPGVMEVRAWR